MSTIIVCQPRVLPRAKWVAAAKTATEVNPLNHAPVERLVRVIPDLRPSVQHLAVLTAKYWQTKGVLLTVGFLDSPPADLRRHIVSHMNAWGKTAKVKFTQTKTDPQVRIARLTGAVNGGYWSYLGTDILQIRKDRPTMNLEGFTMKTSEAEFRRVVRHETGHTMGFPHEHMRRQLVAKIDRAKAFKFYEATQGWSKEEVRQQVLTPIEESSLLGTAHADPSSIMCYQIPASITKDSKPILGGKDINAKDRAFAASIYPR